MCPGFALLLDREKGSLCVGKRQGEKVLYLRLLCYTWKKTGEYLQ